jgi:hypothetical protein
MSSDVIHILLLVFHLGIILILVLGFYSGQSGRDRTLCIFSLCVVSLLSSRFSASALVWFFNFLNYLALTFFISLSTVLIWRSSWILWLFMYRGKFGMNRRDLDLERWRISLLELEAAPIAEFQRSIWVWSVAVAELSEARTVFDRSEAVIAGSNLALRMGV